MNVVIKKRLDHKNKIGVMLFFILFLLGGCTTQQSSVKPMVDKPKPTLTVSGKEALWKKRQQQFSKMAAWTMNGKVAMRYKVDNWSFGVDWLQKGINYSVINIKNPFTGATVALLTQKNNKVTLKASDGKIYQDTNAERLLKKQARIELPLEGLIYWARGISAPQYPKAKVVLDALGRPKKMIQANWTIKYKSYKGNAYNSLPRKIILTRKKNAVYVNMVAKKWQTK